MRAASACSAPKYASMIFLGACEHPSAVPAGNRCLSSKATKCDRVSCPRARRRASWALPEIYILPDNYNEAYHLAGDGRRRPRRAISRG